MDWIVNAANWFVGLFKTGGEVFISWMTGIVPLVLVLLVAYLLTRAGRARHRRSRPHAASARRRRHGLR